MPTRIVLDSNPVPSQLQKRETSYPHVHLTPTAKAGEGGEPKNEETNVRKRNKKHPSALSSSRRTTSGFRSSILRELSVRQSSPVSSNRREDDVDDDGSASPKQKLRISSGDIRASPRFLGYLFSTISGSVLLVSVVQFLEKEIRDTVSSPDVDEDQFFETTDGVLVYRWKLWGAIWASSTIVGMCLIIMLLHYDTVCLPKLWMAIFRDGSLAERNIILFLILIWMAAIHVCTSSLSVGEVQANVYFTCWITFGSIALTYGVWRESAGLPTLMDMMNQHKRETTYNWIWILIFSTVFAGAATDIYYNRSELELHFQGEIVDLQQSNWILVLLVVWADVAVCILAVFFNEWFSRSRKLPCACHRPSGTYRCVLGWRQVEGLVMIAGTGAKFWVIWDYTGVDGVVNGLSNAYFGIWGSFFNSVFALGTWLKENQNTEYFVRDDDSAAEDVEV